MKPSVCFLIFTSCIRVLAAEPSEDAAKVEKWLPNFGPEVLKVEKNIGDHPTDKKPVILVDAEMDGSATIRGKKVSADQLAKHLKDLEKDRTKWRIVLRGPAKTPATTIQKLMTAVGEAGYEDISFAASSKEAPNRRNDAEPSGSDGKLAPGSVLRLSETDIAGAAIIRGEYVVSSKGGVNRASYRHGGSRRADKGAGDPQNQGCVGGCRDSCEMSRAVHLKRMETACSARTMTSSWNAEIEVVPSLIPQPLNKLI